MRWILSCCLCIAFAAAGFGNPPVKYQTPSAPAATPYTIPVIPMQVVPVQLMQVVAVAPPVVQAPTLPMQSGVRWGLFRRRLVPTQIYTLGPQLSYGIMAAPPPQQPSFRQSH